ncbi:MAG: BrnT family toxin [Anaerolineae bacterium]|nr:BrnT family toxin [Anaerolineae bacterium]MCO5189782.1 BrnT family toxin [Anaerolineae bacterium]MCO5207268.1 BrnT family toxin [Anaerolineae bacterium]
MLEFEWNSAKAESNITKHGVAFQEAMTVFGDELAVMANDPDHSAEEDRYITLGMSVDGRLLLVLHTYRGDTIRIISCRKATRSERDYYASRK